MISDDLRQKADKMSNLEDTLSSKNKNLADLEIKLAEVVSPGFLRICLLTNND